LANARPTREFATGASTSQRSSSPFT
jgi:hypothetical protein